MSAMKNEWFWQVEVLGGDWRRFDSYKLKTGGIAGRGKKYLLRMSLCPRQLILVKSSMSVHHACRCHDDLSCPLGIDQAQGSQHAWSRGEGGAHAVYALAGCDHRRVHHASSDRVHLQCDQSKLGHLSSPPFPKQIPEMHVQRLKVSSESRTTHEETLYGLFRRCPRGFSGFG